MIKFKKDKLFRIGEKLVSYDKAARLVERTLELREKGLSQQEAARKLNLDRSFISRLESAGEVRKGSRVAVIGFPLANGEELSALCRDKGLDVLMLLSNKERWELVEGRQALEFFNTVTALVARLREFDTVVMITSVKWSRLAEALLDCQVIHLDLGPSPIEADMFIEPGRLSGVLDQVLDA